MLTLLSPAARAATTGPQGLPDADVVRVLLVCIMKSINMTGKNQTQIMQVRVLQLCPAAASCSCVC